MPYTAEELRWWRYADVDLQSNYVTRRFDQHGGVFTPDSRRKILILGDSFAQDFANMAHEAGAWDGAQIRTVYVPTVCQVVDVTQDTSDHIAPVDRPVCDSTPTVRSSMSLIGQADIVVLAAHWQRWSARLLPQTISNMRLRADQRVFVIGPKHFPAVDIRKLLALGKAGRAALRPPIRAGERDTNRLMEKSLPPDVFVDQIRIVCGADGRCPVVTNQDKLISYDGGHLTQAGAEYIGKKIFAESALAAVR